MKKISIAIILGITMFLAFSVTANAKDYGYRCNKCPANWDNLNIDNNNCGGPEQSPIAFSSGDAVDDDDLSDLDVRYGDEEVEVVPEKTSTNIEWGEESGVYAVYIDDKDYVFKQFHFHTTSEHVVNGERSDLEMHFVNKTEDGEALVLAVFINSGEENEAFTEITESLSTKKLYPVKVMLRDLLPENVSAFRYTGSTTTPTCSGGVIWNLMKEEVQLDADQIQAIRLAIWKINKGFDNNRPIQNLEGREIYSVDEEN